MYVARAADFLRGVAAAFDQQCGDVQSPFVPAVCDELHGVRAEVVISVADDCDIGCRPGGVQKAFLQTALQWCVNVSTTMKVPLQELRAAERALLPSVRGSLLPWSRKYPAGRSAVRCAQDYPANA
jgi:hypothetical protein